MSKKMSSPQNVPFDDDIALFDPVYGTSKSVESTPPKRYFDLNDAIEMRQIRTVKFNPVVNLEKLSDERIAVLCKCHAESHSCFTHHFQTTHLFCRRRRLAWKKFKCFIRKKTKQVFYAEQKYADHQTDTKIVKSPPQEVQQTLNGGNIQRVLVRFIVSNLRCTIYGL